MPFVKGQPQTWPHANKGKGEAYAWIADRREYPSPLALIDQQLRDKP